MYPSGQPTGRSKRIELLILIAAIGLAVIGFALYCWWSRIFGAERDIISHNNDAMLQNRYHENKKIFKK